MKFAAIALALLLSLAPGTLADTRPVNQPMVEQPTENFRDNLYHATLAVYAGKQVCGFQTIATFFGDFKMWGCEFKEQFVCTATVVRADGHGDYVGLTTGHCFDYEIMDKLKAKYYVADNVREKPVLREIQLVKFDNSDRYDYALFTFKSLTPYPVIPIYLGEGTPLLGSRVINVNYSLGITKEAVEGPVVSEQIGDSESEQAPHLRRRFFVQIPFGPGASGSAVVYETPTGGAIVGLVEAMFPGTQMAAVVIPTGVNYINFLQDDSAGLKPEPEPEHPLIAPKAPSPKAPVKPSTLMKVLTFLRRLFGFFCLDI